MDCNAFLIRYKDLKSKVNEHNKKGRKGEIVKLTKELFDLYAYVLENNFIEFFETTSSDEPD